MEMMEKSGISCKINHTEKTVRYFITFLAIEGINGSNMATVLTPEMSEIPSQDQNHHLKQKPSETILVVEDDALLLEFVNDFLSALGYQVITASNPRIALKFIENPNHHIDLVFSDIRMPGGLNGIEFLRHTKTLCPNLKFLLTTGFASEIIKEPIQEEFQIIQKPYFPEALNQIIRSILDDNPDHKGDES